MPTELRYRKAFIERMEAMKVETGRLRPAHINAKRLGITDACLDVPPTEGQGIHKGMGV
jgi:hypothetical protein